MRRTDKTGTKAACQILLSLRGQGKQNMNPSPPVVCQSMLLYLLSSVKVARGSSVSWWPGTARGVTEGILKILYLLAMWGSRKGTLFSCEPFSIPSGQLC